MEGDVESRLQLIKQTVAQLLDGIVRRSFGSTVAQLFAGSRGLTDLHGHGINEKTARLVVTLCCVHAHLSKGTLHNKRDLYYDHPALFKSQTQSDRVLHKVMRFLGCTTLMEAGFVASARGLFAGKVDYDHADRVTVDTFAGRSTLSSSVPPTAEAIIGMRTDAAMVLIVEKETAFMHLLHAGFPERCNAVLVTGRGYPSESTRVFVHKLCTLCRLPAAILTDGDPYGLEIALTFQQGLANSHRFALPDLVWIGIGLDDVEQVGIAGNDSTRILRLTSRDRKKIASLVPRVDEMWGKQLLQMARRQAKVEIEAIMTASPNALIDLVEFKVAMLRLRCDASRNAMNHSTSPWHEQQQQLEQPRLLVEQQTQQSV